MAPRSIGELGFTINTGLASPTSLVTLYNDVAVGDGIFVQLMAPSKSSAGAPVAQPLAVSDFFGNPPYDLLASAFWEANPPNVNEGVSVGWFYVVSQVAMPAGSTIVGAYTNAVFDMSIRAWQIHHDGGATAAPTLLGKTADHDTTVKASAQVTQTVADWTPARDNAVELALFTTAKVGGTGSFGAVAGYDGFYQAQFRSVTGSKQTYLNNAQTHGADVYEVVPFSGSAYELDLGKLPGGVDIPSFNGAGQTYSAGAGAWKGVSVWGFD